MFLLKSMQEDVLATLKAFTGSADQMRKTTIIAIAIAAAVVLALAATPAHAGKRRKENQKMLGRSKFFALTALTMMAATPSIAADCLTA